MAKLTHEQQQRHMAGLRRWHATRSEAEKKITAIKGRLTRQKNSGIKPPGRLAASSWPLDDEVDDAS